MIENMKKKTNCHMLLRRRCSLFVQFSESETEGESKRKKREQML